MTFDITVLFDKSMNDFKIAYESALKDKVQLHAQIQMLKQAGQKAQVSFAKYIDDMDVKYDKAVNAILKKVRDTVNFASQDDKDNFMTELEAMKPKRIEKVPMP